MKSPLTRPLLILLAAAGSASAGWIGAVSPATAHFPEQVSLTYSANPSTGEPTFRAALDQLAAKGDLARLRFIQLHEFLADDTFQRELFDLLQRDHPEQLSAALASAGNLHNPAVSPLRSPWRAAVPATTLGREIARDLAARGLAITGVEAEKFEIRRQAGHARFFAGLALRVAPATDAPTSPDPR